MELFQPKITDIVDIIQETSDIKTFLISNPAELEFSHKPGQFALLTPEFGSGEMVISISSSPFQKNIIEFSVKKVGHVTTILHNLEPGDQIGIRGPYGRSFPMYDLAGKDLIFIGGGIGLAPLRSVINTVFAEPDKYGEVTILYGARTPTDLVFKEELFNKWPIHTKTRVACTVDEGDATWSGEVGFVPMLMDKIVLTTANTKVLTCGPPIMIKFILTKLLDLGYLPKDIITTLEMKMKCGIGKCGRCNVGSSYVCQDGPVFTLEELQKLPNEY